MRKAIALKTLISSATSREKTARSWGWIVFNQKQMLEFVFAIICCCRRCLECLEENFGENVREAEFKTIQRNSFMNNLRQFQFTSSLSEKHSFKMQKFPPEEICLSSDIASYKWRYIRNQNVHLICHLRFRLFGARTTTSGSRFINTFSRILICIKEHFAEQMFCIN